MYFGSLKPGREAKMERYQVTFKALSKPVGSPSPEPFTGLSGNLVFKCHFISMK